MEMGYSAARPTSKRNPQFGSPAIREWVLFLYALLYALFHGALCNYLFHNSLLDWLCADGWAMLECSMCRGQACDRYTEWGAGYVVVADHMTELDRVRVTAVFTADAHFKVGAGLAAFCNCPLHQGSNAMAVNGLEGVLYEDALFLVSDQEVAFCIVA